MPDTTTTAPDSGKPAVKPPSAMKAALAVVNRLKASPAPTMAELGALVDRAMRDVRPNPGVCHCQICLDHLAKHGESKLAKANRDKAIKEQLANAMPQMP